MRTRDSTLIVCLWPSINFEVPLLNWSYDPLVMELEVLHRNLLIWLVKIVVDQDLCLLNNPLEDVHRHKFFDLVLLLLLLVGRGTLEFGRGLIALIHKRVAEAVPSSVNGDNRQLGLFLLTYKLIKVPTAHNVQCLLAAQEFCCLLCKV